MFMVVYIVHPFSISAQFVACTSLMMDAVNVHGSLYCAPFFYICSVCGMYM